MWSAVIIYRNCVGLPSPHCNLHRQTSNASSPSINHHHWCLQAAQEDRATADMRQRERDETVQKAERKQEQRDIAEHGRQVALRAEEERRRVEQEEL